MTPASFDSRHDLTAAEVLARHPALAPLLRVDGAPWRFLPMGSELTGQRLSDSTVEALWIVDDHHAGAIRVRTRDVAVTEVDFGGPLIDAVRLLSDQP